MIIKIIEVLGGRWGKKGDIGLRRWRKIERGELELDVEIDMREKEESKRVNWGKVGRVKVSEVENMIDGWIGCEDEEGKMRIFKLGMVEKKKENRIREIMKIGKRCIEREIEIGLRKEKIRLGKINEVKRIIIEIRDLIEREMKSDERVEEIDEMWRIKIRDRIKLKRMKIEERGNMVKGKRSIIEKKEGSWIRNEKMGGN